MAEYSYFNGSSIFDTASRSRLTSAADGGSGSAPHSNSPSTDNTCSPATPGSTNHPPHPFPGAGAGINGGGGGGGINNIITTNTHNSNNSAGVANSNHHASAASRALSLFTGTCTTQIHEAHCSILKALLGEKRTAWKCLSSQVSNICQQMFRNNSEHCNSAC